MVNFLHVVAVFQHIDQTQQLRRCFCIHICFGGWNHRHFSRVRFQTRRFQRVTHFTHLFPRGVNVNCAVVEGHHVFSTCFQRRFHDGVFVALFKGDHAFFAEQISHGTVGTEVAARFRERVTHFRNSTVTVVRQTFNHNGCTARTITFIDDGFHVGIFITTHTARDCTVQGVTGHVVSQRFINRCTQTRVSVRIAAAEFCRRHQLTNYFGENFTAFSILRCFTVSGVGPFTMTCHK